MAIGYGVPVPKGKTRKQVRAKAKREDAKQLKAFRDACWDLVTLRGCLVAVCAECRCDVYRDREPFGYVHHIISRRHKATRTDPRNGEILCRKCHNERHGREF